MQRVSALKRDVLQQAKLVSDEVNEENERDIIDSFAQSFRDDLKWLTHVE